MYDVFAKLKFKLRFMLFQESHSFSVFTAFIVLLLFV